ncbi:MAG: dTMP kinase [Gammaproteobacteria bacterium]|nr:dTMP kinase [Gammaproteobacteria bacterium]
MRGKFITIEGGEGVGKTTNINFIQELLSQAQVDFISTREPGGTPFAEKIRDLLLDAKQTRISDDTELLMMFAARAQHLAELILPALDKGQWVICDRFTDATYAYQGGGRGIDNDRIKVLEDWVQGDLRPDLTLLLDVPVEVGMKRASERSAPDRFEQEQNEFFQRVRTAYLQRAEAEPQRYRVIDASLALDAVQSQIRAVLEEVVTP